MTRSRWGTTVATLGFVALVCPSALAQECIDEQNSCTEKCEAPDTSD